MPQPVAETPEGLSQPSLPKREDARGTRKRMSFWDRIKILLLLVAVWWILVWALIAKFPGIITFREAVLTEVRSGAWVFVLMGLEAVRQIHYLISEHSARYHHFWTVTFFGGIERLSHRRLSNWTRFRLWRLYVLFFWVAILALVLSKFLGTSPLDRKSTRLNSSHMSISYAVFCLI